MPPSTGENGIRAQRWSERLGIFVGALKRKKKNWKEIYFLMITKARKETIFSNSHSSPALLYPFVWAAITDPYAKQWKLFFRSICLLGRLLGLFHWQLWNHHWVCHVCYSTDGFARVVCFYRMKSPFGLRFGFKKFTHHWSWLCLDKVLALFHLLEPLSLELLMGMKGVTRWKPWQVALMPWNILRSFINHHGKF